MLSEDSAELLDKVVAKRQKLFVSGKWHGDLLLEK
jgi:hypothetical protein